MIAVATLEGPRDARSDSQDDWFGAPNGTLSTGRYWKADSAQAEIGQTVVKASESASTSAPSGGGRARGDASCFLMACHGSWSALRMRGYAHNYGS